MPEEEIHNSRRGFLRVVLGAAAHRVVPFSLPSPIAAMGEAFSAAKAQVSAIPAIISMLKTGFGYGPKLPTVIRHAHTKILLDYLVQSNAVKTYSPHNAEYFNSPWTLDSVVGVLEKCAREPGVDWEKGPQLDYAAIKKDIVQSLRDHSVSEVGNQLQTLLLPQGYISKLVEIVGMIPELTPEERSEIRNAKIDEKDLKREKIINETLPLIFAKKLQLLKHVDSSFQKLSLNLPFALDLFFDAPAGVLNVNPFDREGQSASKAILAQRLHAFVELAYAEQAQGQRLGFFKVPPEVEEKLNTLCDGHHGASSVPQIQGEEREKVRFAVTEAITKAVNGAYTAWSYEQHFGQGPRNPEKAYAELMSGLGERPPQVSVGDVASSVRVGAAGVTIATKFLDEAHGGDRPKEPEKPSNADKPLAIEHSKPDPLDFENPIIPVEAQMAAAAAPRPPDQS